MIKLSLSPTTPLTPEEQAAVDAWLDAAAKILEAEFEQRWINLHAFGCSHPEMFKEYPRPWPPNLAPLVTDS